MIRKKNLSIFHALGIPIFFIKEMSVKKNFFLLNDIVCIIFGATIFNIKLLE